MNIMSLSGRLVIVIMLIITVAACATTTPVGTSSPEPSASQTANAGATSVATNPVRAPTSTLAPTFEPVDQVEINQAGELIQKGKYEAAISILRPIYLSYQENPDPRQAADLRNLQEQLAGAYLAWGRMLVAESTGDLRQISIAYDRFNDGVTVALEESSTWRDLVIERDMARAMIDGARAFEQLKADIAADQPPAELQAALEHLLKLLGQVRDEQADYPGLAPMLQDALITGASLYEENPGETTQERDTTLSRALDLCTQAQTLDAESVEAGTCVERITGKLRVLRATPTPRPTARPTSAPGRLRFQAANYNDDPSCISVQISGIGTGGWAFIVDGIGLRGNFDNSGNARLCGLGAYQEVTFTVIDNSGRLVPGGGGIPSKGSAIMVANWR